MGDKRKHVFHCGNSASGHVANSLNSESHGETVDAPNANRDGHHATGGARFGHWPQAASANSGNNATSCGACHMQCTPLTCMRLAFVHLLSSSRSAPLRAALRWRCPCHLPLAAITLTITSTISARRHDKHPNEPPTCGAHCGRESAADGDHGGPTSCRLSHMSLPRSTHGQRSAP